MSPNVPVNVQNNNSETGQNAKYLSVFIAQKNPPNKRQNTQCNIIFCGRKNVKIKIIKHKYAIKN